MKRTTLWTVEKAHWGFSRSTRYVFTDYKKAKGFSNQDYADSPVKRTYSEDNARRIIEIAHKHDLLNPEF